MAVTEQDWGTLDLWQDGGQKSRIFSKRYNCHSSDKPTVGTIDGSSSEDGVQSVFITLTVSSGDPRYS